MSFLQSATRLRSICSSQRIFFGISTIRRHSSAPLKLVSESAEQIDAKPYAFRIKALFDKQSKALKFIEDSKIKYCASKLGVRPVQGKFYYRLFLNIPSEHAEKCSSALEEITSRRPAPEFALGSAFATLVRIQALNSKEQIDMALISIRIEGIAEIQAEIEPLIKDIVQESRDKRWEQRKEAFKKKGRKLTEETLSTFSPRIALFFTLPQHVDQILAELENDKNDWNQGNQGNLLTALKIGWLWPRKKFPADWESQHRIFPFKG